MFSNKVTDMYGHKLQQQKKNIPKKETQILIRNLEKQNVQYLLYLHTWKAIIRILHDVNLWMSGYQRLLSSLSKKKRSFLSIRKASNAFSSLEDGIHLRSDKVLVWTLTTANKWNFALTGKTGASINTPLRNAAMTAKEAVHCHSFFIQFTHRMPGVFKEHISVAPLCYCL